MDTYFFTFVRHGESQGNSEGRIQGRSDFPLTELGIQQAQALASLWQSQQVGFDLVISSPLVRSVQTAEILANAVGAPLTFDPIWVERSFGRWEGMPPEEIRLQHPGVDFSHPIYQPGEDGESIMDLFQRGANGLHSLMLRPPGRYLIVSHGAILNMVFYAVLGIHPQYSFQHMRFHLSNTGFSQFSYEAGPRVWRIHSINNLAHLQAERG